MLYPESFCNKNLAIRKVFAFCDSVQGVRFLLANHSQLSGTSETFSYRPCRLIWLVVLVRGQDTYLLYVLTRHQNETEIFIFSLGVNIQPIHPKSCVFTRHQNKTETFIFIVGINIHPISHYKLDVWPPGI